MNRGPDGSSVSVASHRHGRALRRSRLWSGDISSPLQGPLRDRAAEERAADERDDEADLARA